MELTKVPIQDWKGAFLRFLNHEARDHLEVPCILSDDFATVM
jgi:hypothetical protein